MTDDAKSIHGIDSSQALEIRLEKTLSSYAALKDDFNLLVDEHNSWLSEFHRNKKTVVFLERKKHELEVELGESVHHKSILMSRVSDLEKELDEVYSRIKGLDSSTFGKILSIFDTLYRLFRLKLHVKTYYGQLMEAAMNYRIAKQASTDSDD